MFACVGVLVWVSECVGVFVWVSECVGKCVGVQMTPLALTL